MNKNVNDEIIDRVKQETDLDSATNKSGDVIIRGVTQQLHRPVMDAGSKITRILSEVAKEFGLNPKDFASSFDERTDTLTINYEKDR